MTEVPDRSSLPAHSTFSEQTRGLLTLFKASYQAIHQWLSWEFRYVLDERSTRQPKLSSSLVPCQYQVFVRTYKGAMGHGLRHLTRYLYGTGSWQVWIVRRFCQPAHTLRPKTRIDKRA